MEKIVRESLLYDFYGDLLTDHQKKIYEEVINDLSYTEIAEREGISRQAAFDLVKRVNRQLDGYESRLGLVKKFLTARRKIGELTDTISRLEEDYQKNPALKEKLDDIRKKSEQILEEF